MLKTAQHIDGNTIKSLQSSLKELGFQNNEIKVYLDILQCENAYVSSISLRTGIERTTVYSVLKRLLERNVIAQTQINGVAAYTTMPFSYFLDTVQTKMQELEKQKNKIQGMVNTLELLQMKQLQDTQIRMYQGMVAIKNLYAETLVENSEQMAFLTLTHMSHQMKEYLSGEFMELKKKRNVFSRVLVADSLRSRKYQQLDGVSGRETRIVSEMPFDLFSEIILFQGGRVAIIDFHSEVHGLVIQSETFYKTMKTLFDCIWLTAINKQSKI